MQDQYNPYSSPTFVIEAPADARAAFIQKTYLHLAGAVTLFALILGAIVTLVPEATMMGLMTRTNLMIVFGLFIVGSWVGQSWAIRSTSLSWQYAGLGLFVLVESIVFAPMVYAAAHFMNDPLLLPSAILTTMLVFGSLTAYVFISKTDFSFLGGFLTVAGVATFALIILSMIMGFSLGILFSYAMVMFASCYILYDTSKIMYQYREDQYVAAALGLFASVALLFWYILRIFMSRD
ncbi:MAG: permease [Blastopirellula sp.]|nr:MAG: permease [Blastopirellula sp.]